MKSVLFLSLMNGGDWGGSEEQWYHTALWMAKNNYQVSICCYAWDKEEKTKRLQILQNVGCRIFLLPDTKTLKGFFGKRKLKIILNKIPFENFDFVFVNQGGWSEVIHGPFKTLYKRFKAYALSSHNYNVKDRLSNNKKAVYNNWINYACVNIGDAGRIFDVLKQYLSIDVPNTEVIYNPITFAVPITEATYPAMMEGKYLWVMLAELDTRRKAQDVLIRALASQKWKSRNWELHIYGKGRDEQMLANLIKENGLEDKVFLKGFSENVQDVLQNSHTLLQITHIDAMPISVVEAMAMARPCLVSDVGDMALWVTNGENGFVCPRATETDINNMLEKHWELRDRWKEMGENAFATFQKKYPQPYEKKTVDILVKYYGTKA